MNYVLGASAEVKQYDSKCHAKVPDMPTTVQTPITKGCNILYIPNFNGNSNAHENFLCFTIVVNLNDFMREEAE